MAGIFACGSKTLRGFWGIEEIFEFMGLFVEFAACFRLFVCDKIGTQRSVLHI